MWYDIIRHSVNVKIMCRFPNMAFKVKAHLLFQDYLVYCLNQKIKPATINISEGLVNDWLTENRLTQRKPNRR